MHTPHWEMVEACSGIDIESCFDLVFEPPIDFQEECRKRQEAAQPPSCCTVERLIGNTWCTIGTACNGNELLTDKVKRLIVSVSFAICSEGITSRKGTRLRWDERRVGH